MKTPAMLFAFAISTFCAGAENVAALAIFDKHRAFCDAKGPGNEKPMLTGSIELSSLLVRGRM